MKIPFALQGAEFNVIGLEYKPNKRLIIIHHTDGDDTETTILTEIQWNEIRHISSINAEVELTWAEDTLTFIMSDNIELTQHENLQHLVFTQKGWQSVVIAIDSMMCSRFQKPQIRNRTLGDLVDHCDHFYITEPMSLLEINDRYSDVVFTNIKPIDNNMFTVTSYQFEDMGLMSEIRTLNDKGMKNAIKLG